MWEGKVRILMALSYIVPVILLAIVVMIIAGARGETNKGG